MNSQYCQIFLSLRKKVERAIEELGGSVVPKLNWSCPTDALWCSLDGTLQCRKPEEIFLLFQASDYIIHDLFHAFDCCGEFVKNCDWSRNVNRKEPENPEKFKTQGDTQNEKVGFYKVETNAKGEEGKYEKNEKQFKVEDSRTEAIINDDYEKNEEGQGRDRVMEELCDEEYYISLRKWSNLHSGREFRCFVSFETLIAISQRNYTNFYPFLLLEKEKIMEKIEVFFTEKVLGNFPDPHFVFDVYVDSKFRVVLLDFNPFCSLTHPLLYEWPEILSIGFSDSTSPSSLSVSNLPNSSQASHPKRKTHMKIVDVQPNIRNNEAMLNRLPYDFYADSVSRFEFAKTQQSQEQKYD